MKQLLNAYTFYFNKKYDRTGPIFEGRYKAVRILTDDLLLHITRYIHLNPIMADLTNDPKNYKWSSYKDYLTNISSELTNPKIVLSYFPNVKEYQRFVQDQISYAKKLEKIKHLTLD